MKKGLVTIKDIARTLNISASTVSRALNNHPSIKKETKSRVKRTAKKMDYRPNLLARSLFMQKTNTVGVIVPGITNHFFSAIITGIQDVTKDSRFNILIGQSNECHKEEAEIINNMVKMRVEGILISPTSSTKNITQFRKLQKSQIPVVVFDRDCPSLKSDKVLVDDYHGAFQAVDYLIKSGCKRVAHLGGPLNLSITEHRLQGYLDALKKNGLRAQKKYIAHTTSYNYEDGIEPSKTLLQQRMRPDGIFAANDCIAISAMHSARKMDLRIPQDVSIIGFDDEPHSSYFKPALSTIWQPTYSIGMLAMRILLKRIESDEINADFRNEIFKSELVLRDSTKNEIEIQNGALTDDIKESL